MSTVGIAVATLDGYVTIADATSAFKIRTTRRDGQSYGRIRSGYLKACSSAGEYSNTFSLDVIRYGRGSKG